MVRWMARHADAGSSFTRKQFIVVVSPAFDTLFLRFLGTWVSVSHSPPFNVSEIRFSFKIERQPSSNDDTLLFCHTCVVKISVFFLNNCKRLFFLAFFYDCLHVWFFLPRFILRLRDDKRHTFISEAQGRHKANTNIEKRR